MDTETIGQWLGEIRQAMEVKVDVSEPTGILEKLNNLSNLLGLNAQCIAVSERLYNERIGQLVLAKEYKNLGATEKKLLFNSIASTEISLMTLSQAQSKDLHYSLEALRSMLSYLKNEMNAFKTNVN
jgi:hypothetical protein